MKLSFVAFFLLILVESCLTAAITGKFAKDGTDYICRVFNQSYHVDDKVLKIYGKHLKAKVNETTLVYGNNNVTVFDASNKQNDIQKVPTTVLLIFPNMEEMKLEAMNLKVINENSFKSCSNLKKLSFGEDNIEFISSGAFESCKNLEEIVFNGNVINSIHNEAFRGLSKLKILSFIRNNFTHINPELFKPLTELTELTIAGNPITALNPDVFLALKNLTVLNLEGNKLVSVSSQLFRFKEKLESVNFRNNSIVTIDNRMLENWPNNAELNLLGNECIDKNFGRLGTDELPMSDVVGYLIGCYDLLKVLEIEKVNNSLDNSNESAENMTTLFTKSNETSDSLEFAASANSSAEIIPGLDNSNSTSTTVGETGGNLSEAHDESSRSQSHEKNESFSPSTTKTQAFEDRKNFNNDFVNGQPIYFRENVTSLDDEERKEDEGEEDENEEFSGESELEDESSFDEGDYIVSTTPNPSSSDDFPSFIDDADLSGNLEENNSSSMDENSESSTNSTTEKPSALSEEASLTYLASPVGSNTTMNESISGPRNSSEILDVPSTTGTPYLHSYEQADCRFYVNAKNEYTCVLKNVKNTLKHINIKHIDKDFTNDNVTVLFIRDCELLHIPRVIFDKFPHLKSLSVESCGIKTMDADLFKVCGNLQKLDLANNKIHLVKGDSLKMCPMLSFVDLTLNPVEKVESSIFECNPKLNISLGALQIVSHFQT